MTASRSRYASRRQSKKRLVWFFVTACLLLGAGLLYWFKFGASDHGASTNSVTITPENKSLAKNVVFDWPEDGQAAVGSVEGGLLARSSDKEELRPTASMAKVIAALAIMEKQPFEVGQSGQTYILTANDVEYYQSYVAKGGSVVPVYEGMRLTQYQAMQAMLIASGNNIADTLIDQTFGSMSAYRSYATKMLRRMGLKETIVMDASGYNPQTVSTPSELVVIGIAALENPVIAEIVAQPQVTISGIGTFRNTNDLLGNNGVIGIKTGTTIQAGNCLLFAAKLLDQDMEGITIVGVVMGESNAASLYDEVHKLLDSIKRGYDLIEDPSVSTATPTQSRPERLLQR